MNLQEVLGILQEEGNHSFSRIVRLKTKTEPKLKKNTRFPDGVSRIAVRFGIIGCSYESCVRNITQDNTFVAAKLWNGFGIRVENNPYLVMHKTTKKLYLQFRPSQENHVISMGEDIWIDNKTGKTIDKSEVEEYLPKASDQSLFWRTIAIENVLELACNQTTFVMNERT